MDVYVEDMRMPLDQAVALMAQGIDLNEIEGWDLIDPLFDPYFED
jgi:hypothetical protein